MKDTLDAQFSTARVMILGDYNDDLDSTISVGVSPKISSYDELVKDSTDADHYKSLSMPLSKAGLSSTTSYPEMIDHVAISNEISSDVVLRSTKLVKEVEGWISDYATTTTDHYPIMNRLLMPPAVTGLLPITAAEIGLKLLPNPVTTELNISFKPEVGVVQISILDINGKTILKQPSYRTAAVVQSVSINLHKIPSGIYVLKIINNQKFSAQKFIKL